MKKTILLIISLCFYFACSSSAKENASEVSGEKIFKSYCVACHGVKGNMGTNGAFDLTRSTLPLPERIEVITNGRNAMTPFKTLLSEEKIKAVAEYVEELRKQPEGGEK